MGLSYKTAHLTKTWVKLLFCSLLLVGFLIIWLLIGEINLLHQQWLIPYKGVMWSGKINDTNYLSIFNTYSQDITYWDSSITNADLFKSYAQDTTKFPNGISILSSSLKFNALILIPLLVTFVISIIIPLITRKLKWMEIDILIFTIPFSLAAITFIFSGLIPQTFGAGWCWLVKCLILLVSLIIFFLLTNYFINGWIGRSGLAEQAINDITADERDRNQSRKTLRDLTNTAKKQDKMEYVDIDKDN
ncbi:MAG: hypothetical protein LBJ97_03250 [Mycoplasmataceae bacterium]|nr:hypothetical protein [Mycoplasmataceae bacterium]